MTREGPPALLPQLRDDANDPNVYGTPIPVSKSPNYGQTDKTHDGGPVTVRARTALWVCENRNRKRPRMQLKAPKVGF